MCIRSKQRLWGTAGYTKPDGEQATPDIHLEKHLNVFSKKFRLKMFNNNKFVNILDSGLGVYFKV